MQRSALHFASFAALDVGLNEDGIEERVVKDHELDRKPASKGAFFKIHASGDPQILNPKPQAAEPEAFQPKTIEYGP